MPYEEKYLVVNGISATESCLRCKHLCPDQPQGYRCMVTGHCPAFLTEDEKEFIRKYFYEKCSIRMKKTFEEEMDETHTRNAEEIENVIDKELFEKLMRDASKRPYKI